MNQQSPIGPKITVIGIGEDGIEGLSPSARKKIENAAVIFGGSRHLSLLPEGILADCRKWISPFIANLPLIEDVMVQNPVVLASGDPMFFGVGTTLINYFGSDRVDVIPASSSISLAAARLGWSLQDCNIITLHGRAPESLRAHLRPHGKIIALSSDETTPALVAVMLCEAGLENSMMTICERLGGQHERMTTHPARIWQANATTMPDTVPIDRLNLIMIDLKAGGTGQPLPIGPGLSDEAFFHDGMITKSEIRAQSLSSLAPWKGAVLWDLGAGCGSVSVEWMRMGGQAVAIERNAERCAMIKKNALRLGTPELDIRQQSIEEALASIEKLPTPDAIFIGGGITTPGLLDTCWDHLPRLGRLVANSVTLEGETQLFRFYNENGGKLSRLSISHLSPRGSFSGWNSLAPVTHYLGIKP